jgi:hypothetical protein
MSEIAMPEKLHIEIDGVDGKRHSVRITPNNDRLLVGVITYGDPEHPAECVVVGRFTDFAAAKWCFEETVRLIGVIARRVEVAA